ncbi:MAG: hypothetical protein ACXAD7_25015 [Candidatus Kariarchaeaceae archaeon]|jgi:hypothetical protein
MNSTEQSDKIVATAMMTLIQTATKNGVISEQEKILLDEFDLSLQYYAEELKEILNKGRVTKKDEIRLNQLKDMIIENGFQLANEINGVSTDMMNLIISLIFTLKVPKADEVLEVD